MKAPLRKNLGKKNCEFTPELRAEILHVFLAYEENDVSKIFEGKEFGFWSVTVERPLRLRIERERALPAGLLRTDEERAAYQRALDTAPLDDWTAFAKATGLRPALLKKLRPHITVKDAAAQPVAGEADPALRDTENVPLEYPGGIVAFLENEVRPYAPDAYIDEKKTEIGYEISFTKYFYRPIELRSVREIMSDLRMLESSMENLMDDDNVVTRGLYSPKRKFCTYTQWNLCCPATWKVKRVREMFSFRRGLSITKENLETEGIPVINYGQIHSKQNSMLGVTDDILRFVSPSYLYSNPSALVQKGDFIFADTSEDREGSGNCAYIDRDGKIFAGYHSIIAHAKDNLTERKYFAYLFRSPTWRHQIRKKVNGVKVYSITQQILKDSFVVIPTEDEQREIVEYLDNRCYSIDSLIVKMQQKITLLQELKSTLISDVVTGKIDVRDAEIPTNPSME